MPLYTVMTRLLGREPNSEDLPGSVIPMDEDEARELVDLGVLEPAPEDAVATDDSDPVKAALGKLTVKELQFVANSNGVQLGDATKKADIVDIVAAMFDDSGADAVTVLLERVAAAREAFKASQ